jgi:site-specific DNA-adenine methylase
MNQTKKVKRINKSDIFIPWYGNKTSEIYKIEPYFPANYNRVVEAFGGSGAISNYLYNKNNDIKCHINDNDWGLIILYRQLKKDPLAVINHYNFLKNSYTTKDEYINIIKKYKYQLANKDKQNLGSLILFFLKVFNRVSGLCPLGYTTFNDLDINNYNYFFNFLNKAKHTCCDYSKIFKKYKNDENAFLFLDPPYLYSYNATYKSYSGANTNNNNELLDNTGVFIDILNLLKNAKCKIMLIINDNKLVRFLYNDYIKGSYDKLYQTVKSKSKHLIITNY